MVLTRANQESRGSIPGTSVLLLSRLNQKLGHT